MKKETIDNINSIKSYFTIDFIKSYFNQDDNFFITFINHEKGENYKFPQNYLHNVQSFEKYYNAIKNKNSDYSIYFTMNSFKNLEDCTKNDKNYATKTKDNVQKIKSIIFDFDDPNNSKENMEKMIDFLQVKPTYVIETSPNKFQVCFKLLENKMNFDKFEMINKTFATYFKSDLNVCSIEKLFRLPYFLNKKNDFETRLIESNFENVYSFEDVFLSKLKENMELKTILYNLDEGRTRSSRDVIKKNIYIKKEKEENIIPIPKNNNYFENPIKFMDMKDIKKYGFFLKQNGIDSSRNDIAWINKRKNETNDFDLIFNEILFLRNYYDNPLKRNIDEYFISCKKCFEDDYGRKVIIKKDDNNDGFMGR